MKQWQNYQLNVNGFDIDTRYNETTINDVFKPFLRTITELYQKKQERIIVFMAAPPAVGKTTLSLFLEYLSKASKEFEEIQAIGLDGFHYHADYIATHTIQRGNEIIKMQDVKGCPETFDVKKLEEKLALIKTTNITWPIYDRNLHDVIEDVVEVNKNIILLEGNWLLLKDEKWRDLKKYCDLSIMIEADAKMLEERLINRKIQGGYSSEQAIAFYQKSDSVNVNRVLHDSTKADITWTVMPDGDYQ